MRRLIVPISALALVAAHDENGNTWTVTYSKMK